MRNNINDSEIAKTKMADFIVGFFYSLVGSIGRIEGLYSLCSSIGGCEGATVACGGYGQTDAPGIGQS